MPLSANRPARRIWRALPWLVGALPILFGVLIMHLQAQRELQSRAQATAHQAVAQIDQIVDSLAGTAKRLQPLAGQPCAEVQLALREEVTRGAYVRSTNLFSDGAMYCSSLFGSIHEPTRAQDYVDGRLRLMDGNSITPLHPLLVYRAAQGERGAVSTVDGDHLIAALRLIGPGTSLRLRVGDNWMDERGRVSNGPVADSAVANTQVLSSRHGFAVLSGYPAGAAWRLMRSEYPALFGLLVFLGVLAGSACRWQQQRARSPRAELQRALEADEFVPYFQPVVRNGDFRWAGVEVLMRWEHPREGLVRPDLFIPYAEHSGQIVPMTHRLMQRVAESLAPHAGRLADGFHIGINITADHCQDPQLYDLCKSFLACFPPGRVILVLELTERKLVVPSPATDALFARLHDLGVMIALDDFGTGQSSLSYLRQFKVDYLKIDQSFVTMIGGDALSLHILDSIIELSGKLGLGIVAEGVETELQRDYLAGFGVDYQQGYLFARPMPLGELLEALPGKSSRDEPAPTGGCGDAPVGF